MTQAECRQRRDRLMDKIGQGTAIFCSAPMAVMHNDVEYNFRQDSDFYYLTGFNEPEAVAVLAPHHDQHRYVLFVQPKDPERETWTGYRVGVEAAKERYGADEVYSITELSDKLTQYVEKADRIYYHLGRDQDFNTKMLKLWQQCLRRYPRTGQGPIALEDPGPIVHGMRQIKSPQELNLMRHAANISAAAHCRAMDYARGGCYEYQVQAEIEHSFRLAGAMGPAYPSIVASGDNACILHYTENTRQMQDGDLLLIDAGCAVDYYNADITRTFPVGGRFSDEQRLLYDIVLEAQMQAIALAQPGQPYQAMHETAVRVIVEGLLNLGLLVGDRDTLIAEETYKPFYMHRTGHWLGLDVHDVGIYQHGETSHQLEPGHVFTVEPGIYVSPTIQLAEGQPEVPEPWRGIGIRIEDDLVITETGHEVLTSGVPKAIADLTR
ncbi:MAG: aminopeptidase P N-terminal domain-containing protein [Synechococcales cyanobacterium K44_A2020_017]|nr:aminopeptidase P N-terminal domain-containing protein [Synechococcales cyanobacterium K32_A2020_035]MBF2094890.1 aminopeptidase P N-terminal domain-containing protein [Synechococcales cyanobacterium K44_A2020_017]